MTLAECAVADDLVLADAGRRGEVALYALDGRFLVQVRTDGCTTLRTYDAWAVAVAAYERGVERTVRTR